MAANTPSIAGLVELLKKTLHFQEHFGLTTLPRGGLQVVLKSFSDDALLRSYAQGFDAEDRLTWSAISGAFPRRASDVWPCEEERATAYFHDLMLPRQLEHAVCFPLAAPLLNGYPGAIHLLRKGSEGAFSAEEISEATAVITEFETRLDLSRSPRRSQGKTRRISLSGQSAAGSLLALDSTLKPVIHQRDWLEVDPRIREQMIEQAQRRMQQLNGAPMVADRVQFPDSHGNVLGFRVITHQRYPALAQGPVSFFCPQPTCSDWCQLRAADFQADADLSRLIPALTFMQAQFRVGPALAEIAKAAHLSPFHFHRRFTELLGLTPKQFLLECQMHEAKTELIAGDKDLTKIAEECGFAHQSHFTSRFKQATGLTPTRWRRMMLENQRTSSN